MAKYFGQSSKYIGILDRKFLIWFIIAIAFFLAFAFRISQIAEFNYVFVLLILFLAVGIFLFVATKYTVRAKKLSRGRVGEWDIKQELLKLSDEYFVFQSLVVRWGDIDFVVIGPSGVYAIEVKSHSGHIGFDGTNLTQNGRQFPKDFLGQTQRQAMDLKKFLERKLKQKIYVKAVLVFSDRAVLSFGFSPIRNVTVVGKASLIKLIESSKVLDEQFITKAIEAIKI